MADGPPPGGRVALKLTTRVRFRPVAAGAGRAPERGAPLDRAHSGKAGAL